MKLLRFVTGIALIATPMIVGAQESGIDVGSDAPGAAVETLDGKPFDLAEYVKKGPTVLQFWATWCSNCKALEPRINAAITKYAGKVRFVAVAVSVNRGGRRKGEDRVHRAWGGPGHRRRSGKSVEMRGAVDPFTGERLITCLPSPVVRLP